MDHSEIAPIDNEEELLRCPRCEAIDVHHAGGITFACEMCGRLFDIDPYGNPIPEWLNKVA